MHAHLTNPQTCGPKLNLPTRLGLHVREPQVSFLELYNEELTDLLSSSTPSDAGPPSASTSSDAPKLRLLEDRSGVVVNGLDEVIVRSAAEIYAVLDRGTAKRRTAATLLNNRSSRSHSIFTITIHLKETTPEGEDVIKGYETKTRAAWWCVKSRQAKAAVTCSLARAYVLHACL
eukprot:365180-Chlamydomonas_euryale.AAC.14